MIFVELNYHNRPVSLCVHCDYSNPNARLIIAAGWYSDTGDSISGEHRAAIEKFRYNEIKKKYEVTLWPKES